MRSDTQAMNDAWAYVVAGAPQTAAAMFTGVSTKTLERMGTALRKLAKHAPECVPARLTWREADHLAAAAARGQPQAGTIAEAIRKAVGTATVPVSVIAEALAMTNASLPGALMNTWANNNATRGVRHEPTDSTQGA